MKKRTVGILVTVLCVMVAGVSFATGWLVNNQSGTNTVKVGSPITISVSAKTQGGEFDDTLMPGDSASAEFTVALNSQTGYSLAITDVVFEDSSEVDKIGSIGVWSWSLDDEDYTAFVLNEGKIIIDASPSSTDYTLYVKLDVEGNVDVSLADATLTFKLALVK